jgi:anti-sigma factor RsiW
MTCPESLRTQSLLDGQLPEAVAREAERHMESCAACQALAADIAMVSDALRQASRPVAPPALRARVLQDLGWKRRTPRGFWAGAAGGAGLTAAAAALAFLLLLPPSAATLTAAVAEAHGSALSGDRLIAVASSNHHTVKPWLAAHAGLSPPVTDFAGDGFVLAGGRTDRVAGATAAVTVYRHGNHAVDLFAWPDRGASLPGPGMARGFRTAFWKSGDMDFAAVSDIDAAAFAKFIALARAQRE